MLNLLNFIFKNVRQENNLNQPTQFWKSVGDKVISSSFASSLHFSLGRTERIIERQIELDRIPSHKTWFL